MFRCSVNAVMWIVQLSQILLYFKRRHHVLARVKISDNSTNQFKFKERLITYLNNNQMVKIWPADALSEIRCQIEHWWMKREVKSSRGRKYEESDQQRDEILPDHSLNYSGLPFPHLSFHLYFSSLLISQFACGLLSLCNTRWVTNSWWTRSHLLYKSWNLASVCSVFAQVERFDFNLCCYTNRRATN